MDDINELKVSVLFWEDRSDKGAEHDEVVDQVAGALTEVGHQVSLIGIASDLRELVDRLDEERPQLVFNLCERFADNDFFEMNVISVLEMLRQPFTGTGALGAALRQDKAITKKLLCFHEVPYPHFMTFDTQEIEFAGRMRFPLFVKPLNGDASSGIDDASFVTEYRKLVERIDYIQTQLKVPALVEEYIEGREFYVSILGNNPGEVLPIMELDFAKLPDGHPKIYGADAKLDETSEQYNAVNAVVATDLNPEIRARISNVAREAAYALKVRDYSRVDIRLTDDGKPVVLEVNANPYLESTSAFALAALQAGMGYAMVINRIVKAAWMRCAETMPLVEIQPDKPRKRRIRVSATAVHDGSSAESDAHKRASVRAPRGDKDGD